MSDDSREQKASGLVPESATAARLLSVLGLEVDGTPNVTALWSQRNVLGRIPIGLQAGGSPVWLDLNDHLAGGNGPNGVLVGTDGSGKSTALQSMVFALCAQHSPEQLQLMCLSPREWSVFDDFADYPHVVDIPAGTDHSSILLGLLAEHAERGTRRAATEPALIVVVDDLPLYDYRDSNLSFAATLSSLMRLGRQLGVHVLASMQELPRNSTAQVVAQADYRIVQRTATSADSRQLIGSNRAAELFPLRRPRTVLYVPGCRPGTLPHLSGTTGSGQGVGRQLATASGNG